MKRIIAAATVVAVIAGTGAFSAFAGAHNRYNAAQRVYRQEQMAYVCPYDNEACVENGACLTDGTCPYGTPRGDTGYGAGYGCGRCRV